MPQIHLNKTHPNLYKAIFAHALCHYAVGGLILYSALVLTPRRPLMAYLFIALFFIIGTILIYGLKAPHYRFVRYGLIAGLAVIGFLAVVFSLSVGLTLSEEQTIRLSWLLPPWLYWVYQHILCLLEPPFNPESETE
jgi:hypothetical protein